jgi:hypothetical protein
LIEHPLHDHISLSETLLRHEHRSFPPSREQDDR